MCPLWQVRLDEDEPGHERKRLRREESRAARAEKDVTTLRTQLNETEAAVREERDKRSVPPRSLPFTSTHLVSRRDRGSRGVAGATFPSARAKGSTEPWLTSNHQVSEKCSWELTDTFSQGRGGSAMSRHGNPTNHDPESLKPNAAAEHLRALTLAATHNKANSAKRNPKENATFATGMIFVPLLR